MCCISPDTLPGLLAQLTCFSSTSEAFPTSQSFHSIQDSFQPCHVESKVSISLILLASTPNYISFSCGCLVLPAVRQPESARLVAKLAQRLQLPRQSSSRVLVVLSKSKCCLQGIAMGKSAHLRFGVSDPQTPRKSNEPRQARTARKKSCDRKSAQDFFLHHRSYQHRILVATRGRLTCLRGHATSAQLQATCTACSGACMQCPPR